MQWWPLLLLVIGIPGAASSMLGSSDKGTKLLEMLKMAQGSKFMNSAVGMGIKEAGKQYASDRDWETSLKV